MADALRRDGSYMGLGKTDYQIYDNMGRMRDIEKSIGPKTIRRREQKKNDEGMSDAARGLWR
ncbi:MAG: hypothetical protein ACREBH_00315 [Candidatus Micrarchaeaceae archaeon]